MKNTLLRQVIIIGVLFILYYLLLYSLFYFLAYSKTYTYVINQSVVIASEVVFIVFCFLNSSKANKMWKIFFVLISIGAIFSIIQLILKTKYPSLSIPKPPNHIILLRHLFYTVEYCFQIAAWLYLAIQILLKSKRKKHILLSFSPSVLAIIFSLIFVQISPYMLHTDTSHTIWAVIRSYQNLLLFIVLLFCLPVIRQRQLLFLLMGYLLNIIANSLTMKYIFIQPLFSLNNPAYLILILSHIFILYAVIKFYLDKEMYVKGIFYPVDTTRSQIIYWGNSVSLSFFLLLGIYSFLDHKLFQYSWIIFDVNITILIPFVSILSLFAMLLSNIFTKDYSITKGIMKQFNNIGDSEISNKKTLYFDELDKVANYLTNRINSLKKKEERQKNLFAIATRAAHDIRTPLTVLNILSKSIEKQLEEPQKNIYEQSLSDIKTNVTSLLALQKKSDMPYNEGEIERKPYQYVDTLAIEENTDIIIFDDEEIYHTTWDALFKKSALSQYNIQVHHCYTENDFFTAKSSIKTKKLVLIDYDIKGSPLLGIDYIRELGLQKEAILVTNHYDNEAVQLLCEEQNISLLPKPKISSLTINIITNKSS